MLATRLRLFEEFHQDSRVDFTSDSGPPIAKQREHIRQASVIAQSAPFAEVPVADQPKVRLVLDQAINTLWLDYFESPTHANLIKWETALGSSWPPESFQGLTGHPVPPLQGDYWPNTPSGAPVVLSTPGVVSLVVFFDAMEGKLSKDYEVDPNFDCLRRLHAVYPALQIVLVVKASGKFQDEDLRDRPAEEARRLQQYFTEHLHVPGVVCVIRGTFHTEAGATAVPLVPPAFETYHLNPQDYDLHALLVDQDGWVVSTNYNVLQGGLVRRLLAKQ